MKKDIISTKISSLILLNIIKFKIAKLFVACKIILITKNIYKYNNLKKVLTIIIVLQLSTQKEPVDSLTLGKKQIKIKII